MRVLHFALAFLLPFAAALTVRAETPQDERICGQTTDGKVRWCVTMQGSGSCGPSAGEHCDGAGACWCGPSDANVWPGADDSGLPLIAREALQQHRVACTMATHEEMTIGDCGFSGWVCHAGWCQDTANRGWWLTPPPQRRV